jgi:hypothetical protein
MLPIVFGSTVSLIREIPPAASKKHISRLAHLDVGVGNWVAAESQDDLTDKGVRRGGTKCGSAFHTPTSESLRSLFATYRVGLGRSCTAFF